MIALSARGKEREREGWKWEWKEGPKRRSDLRRERRKDTAGKRRKGEEKRDRKGEKERKEKICWTWRDTSWSIERILSCNPETPWLTTRYHEGGRKSLEDPFTRWVFLVLGSKRVINHRPSWLVEDRALLWPHLIETLRLLSAAQSGWLGLLAGLASLRFAPLLSAVTVTRRAY